MNRVSSKSREEQSTGGRNWGDHPYIVGITLIATLISIVTGVISVNDYFEKKNKSVVSTTKSGAGYFVIGFGDHDQTRALNESLRQKKNGFENQIMYSSDWSGLSPGWYIVVYRVYENRSDAETLKKTLAGRNINTYVKYSGDKITPTFNK